MLIPDQVRILLLGGSDHGLGRLAQPQVHDFTARITQHAATTFRPRS